MHQETSTRTGSANSEADADCLLVVLVPAYEYAEGIIRILDALAQAPAGLVRCIIGDDSSSDCVEKAVCHHPAADRVSYHRNRPAMGAIANWNDLLARARGRYLMLLHHDEWPLDETFFHLICSALHENEEVDALILDCLIGDATRTTMRPHMPMVFKQLALKYFPGYLLRRNLFGAPSVFVLRRLRALPFNSQIPWLVDVEWYVRHLRLPGFQVRACSTPKLLSLPHKQSITASLGTDLRVRKRQESSLLLKELPNEWALRLNAPQSIGDSAMAILETVSWTLARGGMRIWHYFSRLHLPSHLHNTTRS